jgi:hypothetical protein
MITVQVHASFFFISVPSWIGSGVSRSPEHWAVWQNKFVRKVSNPVLSIRTVYTVFTSYLWIVDSTAFLHLVYKREKEFHIELVETICRIVQTCSLTSLVSLVLCLGNVNSQFYTRMQFNSSARVLDSGGNVHRIETRVSRYFVVVCNSRYSVDYCYLCSRLFICLQFI